MHVTHVIQSFSRGGGGRALLALVDPGSTVVSLTTVDPLMRDRANSRGATVVESRDPASLADADVVLVHFWNSPELYELLRSALPPLRLAAWVQVAGDVPPQVVTRELVELADIVAVAAPSAAALPAFREPPLVIADAPDIERLGDVTPRSHDGFTVGYIGTLDYEKLHPRFAALCADVNVPDIRVVICGTGAAAPTLTGPPFELRGYVEEIGDVLAELDVFGYPLAPETYAASDLALHEAMAAGVPPVVLAGTAPARIVEDGVTGIVASDEAGYARAIEYLHAQPSERSRLGANARAAARRRVSSDVARDWADVFEDLLQRPKRSRPARPIAGAEAFVAALGDSAPEFAESLAGSAEADARIAAASPVLASAGGGGVLHYRRYYPEDAHLRLWSALVLDAAGNHVLAAGELAAASRLGCTRAATYLERVTEQLA